MMILLSQSARSADWSVLRATLLAIASPAEEIEKDLTRMAIAHVH
jgi:hypothetical protein